MPKSPDDSLQMAASNLLGAYYKTETPGTFPRDFDSVCLEEVSGKQVF